MMVYRTNKSLGNIEFSDSVNDVVSKLSKEDLQYGDRVFMGKRKPTILWKNILIVFYEEKESIEYFEVEKEEVFFDGLNLLETEYSDLEKHFLDLDPNLDVKENGFESYKCGLGVFRKLNNGKYTKYPKQIILFNKDYQADKVPSPADIIKYYLSGKS